MLRRGRWPGAAAVADLTPDAMARMMVGDEPPQRHRHPPGAPSAATSCCDIESLTRATTTSACPRSPSCAWRCARARSSASPACRATARKSWSRCWPASASRAAGRSASAASGYQATRAEMRVLMVRCLPDEPLRNACVAHDVRRREHRLPPLRSAAVPLGGRAGARGALRRHARALIKDYGIRTPGPDAPIPACRAATSSARCWRASCRRTCRC